MATAWRPAITLTGLVLIAASACAPADHAGATEPPSQAKPPEPAHRPSEEAQATADAAYARLLEAVVTDAGLVRYAVLDRPKWRKALDEVIGAYATQKLPERREARLALWCNAYNANVLALVLRERAKPGFTSVAKVPGFFDRAPIVVAGETLTLNDLENRHIRPLGDPRTHAALVCAARSCPPLRAEPFVAARLDAQLDDQCRRWINDPSKFNVVDGVLGLSEILNWYGEDFRAAPYGGARGFVARYAARGGAIARVLQESRETPTRWIEYDWSLNEAQPGAAAPE